MKNKKTVVIGLSGGVDSSVAAFLLKKQGYNVIAAFMKNFSDTKNPYTGECAWIQEKQDAQLIASKLKIPFHVFDFEKEYKSLVIAPMYKDYKKGLTPNPDISCNTIIKFPLFWKYAKELGANYIAMGHYARIENKKDSFNLLSGKDKEKDQSYFLFELSQSDLQHTLFPIGNYTKKEIREIAKKNKFPNWNKKSTRGICFVGKVDMKSFLEKKIKNKPGKILSPEGKVIGKHPGSMYFTIGQRAVPSLGINIENSYNKDKSRLYIAKKKNNNIIIAPENHPILKTKTLILKKFHIINSKESFPNKLKARIRHLGDFHEGKLIKKGKTYQFTFNKPQEAIAPGQSLVLYNKDKVIGGGEIRLK